MKKWATLLLSAILFYSTAIAKENKLPAALKDPITQIIQITDVTKKISLELIAGDLPNIAVECKEGTSTPLQYLGNFGLASLVLQPNLNIKLDKTFYTAPA
jgi:hypothetical protein